MTEKERESQSGDLTRYKAASNLDLSQSENLFSRQALIRRLRKGHNARIRFVESHLNKKLALQIRSLRGDLSQEQMERKVGIKQQVLSRLENPYYGRATLSTLKKIAAGCDVGLLVEFVPFSQFINRVSGTPYIEHGFSPDTMDVPDFGREEREGKFSKGIHIDAEPKSDQSQSWMANLTALFGSLGEELVPLSNLAEEQRPHKITEQILGKKPPRSEAEFGGENTYRTPNLAAVGAQR